MVLESNGPTPTLGLIGCVSSAESRLRASLPPSVKWDHDTSPAGSGGSCQRYARTDACPVPGPRGNSANGPEFHPFPVAFSHCAHTQDASSGHSSVLEQILALICDHDRLSPSPS